MILNDLLQDQNPWWRDAAVRRFGSVSTMIERDANIPPLEDLVAELETARRLAERALAPVDADRRIAHV